jgi:tetratricopeptide (TPR) repeat protein
MTVSSSRSLLGAVRALGFAAALVVGAGVATSALADPDTDAAMKAFNTQQYQQAIDLSTKSITAKESIEALYIRGNAYAATGKFPLAIADLEKARGIAVAGGGGPIVGAIDNSLLTSFMFSGQTDKALAVYHDLKTKNPRDTRIDDVVVQGFQAQAGAAMRAQKIGDAVTALERGATEVPTRAASFYSTAAYYMSTDPKADWKKVQAEAGKALAVDPNNARANFVNGVALANQGDNAGAIASLQKAKAGTDAQVAKDADAALQQLQPPAAPAPAPKA